LACPKNSKKSRRRASEIGAGATAAKHALSVMGITTPHLVSAENTTWIKLPAGLAATAQMRKR
jgi:hypothetical protein